MTREKPEHTRIDRIDEAMSATILEGRGSICMIGNVFGVLFLEEPFSQRASEIYGLLSDLDLDEVARTWPFVPEPTAYDLLHRAHDALEASSREDLIWEYRRLFVGPARKAAPPWGSVYLDKDQVIFGASTLELRQWMRENGISKTTDDEEPEDHIGRMLLLMAWIAENRPDLLTPYLQQHLLTWAPHFLEKVTEETSNGFFSAVSKLCGESLDGLARELAIEVQPVRLYR